MNWCVWWKVTDGHRCTTPLVHFRDFLYQVNLERALPVSEVVPALVVLAKIVVYPPM